MKFLKYFFFALLPIMLLMMFFSYNNFSFIGAKAGASSTTNTINFYGKDNYLIGSYDVPNGQTINQTNILTGYDTNSVNPLPVVRDATNGLSGISAVFNNTYTFTSSKSIFSYNGNAKNFDGDSLYFDFSVSPDRVHDAGSAFIQFGYHLTNYYYPSTLTLNIGEVDFYRPSKPINTTTAYYTIFSFDSNFNYVNSYIVSDDVSSISGYVSYSLTVSDIPGFIYNSSYNYYFGMTINATFDASTQYNFYSLYWDTYDLSLTFSYDVPVYSPLSNIINQDISTAVSNGYLDLQDNYSWSTQSNFNNNFTYDTHIFYDLNLYYVQESKVFNFANGWQSTLGDLSNLSFFTNTALADLIADFNTFNTLNFNGDFLHVLKTIGLAIANIFNLIISLASLIVAPLIDMVSIIVLLITKSSFFWTFT